MCDMFTSIRHNMRLLQLCSYRHQVWVWAFNFWWVIKWQTVVNDLLSIYFFVHFHKLINLKCLQFHCGPNTLRGRTGPWSLDESKVRNHGKSFWRDAAAVGFSCYSTTMLMEIYNSHRLSSSKVVMTKSIPDVWKWNERIYGQGNQGTYTFELTSGSGQEMRKHDQGSAKTVKLWADVSLWTPSEVNATFWPTLLERWGLVGLSSLLISYLLSKGSVRSVQWYTHSYERKDAPLTATSKNIGSWAPGRVQPTHWIFTAFGVSALAFQVPRCGGKQEIYPWVFLHHCTLTLKFGLSPGNDSSTLLSECLQTGRTWPIYWMAAQIVPFSKLLESTLRLLPSLMLRMIRSPCRSSQWFLTGP